VEHAKIEANLKRELAHMGLSGEEIERVVKASGNSLDAGRGKLSAATVEKARKEAAIKKETVQQLQSARQADHEAAIRELVRRGWSQEDIERALNSPSGSSAGPRSGSTAP
jgi:SOS response regulatory protein OraA/RecX